MEEPRQVYRYSSNRNLWDHSAHGQTSLKKLAACIKRGERIQVTDLRTGKDITRRTLAEILTKTAEGLPVALLLQLIRSGH